MIDLVKLKLIAGDGGHGIVSFRREKYVPKGGPDGGAGGNGGSIILRSRRGLTTLRDYAGVNKIEAEDGKRGAFRKRFGEKGEDKIIEVPIGTEVVLLAENKISADRRKKYGFVNEEGEQELLNRADFKEGEVAPGRGRSNGTLAKYYLEDEKQGIPWIEADDLDVNNLKDKLNETLFIFTEDNQEIVICQGGIGGRGNVSFKSSMNTTPLEAEYGSFAEQKYVKLELKLLADLGLVGFPNAGKSTFLSKVTKANPKIANYPFTTIEPNLGIMYLGEGQAKDEIVIADIPGLIEGASEGKGLGLDFLRHVENSKALMFVLYLTEEVIFDQNISDEEKAEMLWDQYQKLKHELETYSDEMVQKSSFLTINKMDLYNAKQIDSFRSYFKQKNMNVIFFSTVSGEGLDKVKKEIAKLI